MQISASNKLWLQVSLFQMQNKEIVNFQLSIVQQQQKNPIFILFLKVGENRHTL